MKVVFAVIGRSFWILLLSLNWFLPASPVARASSATDLLAARVQTPEYQLIDRGVQVPGYVALTVPGAPSLPLYGISFELPDTGEWHLGFESTDSYILTERVDVAAVPVPDIDLNGPVALHNQAELPSAVPVIDRPDPTIYGVDAFYPTSPVVAGEPVVQGGRRILPVRVFPFQYNPVTRQLRYHPDVLIQVQVQGGAEATGAGRAAAGRLLSTDSAARRRRAAHPHPGAGPLSPDLRRSRAPRTCPSALAVSTPAPLRSTTRESRSTSR